MHTNNKRVLGKLLEETFLGRAVNVKVQSLGREQERRKSKGGENGGVHFDLRPDFAVYKSSLSRDHFSTFNSRSEQHATTPKHKHKHKHKHKKHIPRPNPGPPRVRGSGHHNIQGRRTGMQPQRTACRAPTPTTPTFFRLYHVCHLCVNSLQPLIYFHLQNHSFDSGSLILLIMSAQDLRDVMGLTGEARPPPLKKLKTVEKRSRMRMSS